MKNLLIILFIFLTIISCQYRLISPYYLEYDSVFGSNENKTFSIIDANAKEEDIKNALENNKKNTGKNIIIIAGYVSSSDVFDKMKIVLKDESNIELDLSNAVFDNNYAFKLENALFLETVFFASSQKILDNFFNGCESLIGIQLPSLLLDIYDNSFNGCRSLKNIEYLGTSPNVIEVKNADALSGTSPTDLYLPNVSSHNKNDAWKTFLGIKWSRVHYGVSMPR